MTVFQCFAFVCSFSVGHPHCRLITFVFIFFVPIYSSFYRSNPIMFQVYIVGHVPPGSDERQHGTQMNGHTTFSEKNNLRYLQLVRKYSSIISGQFFGHLHSDSFRIIYNDHGKSEHKMLFVISKQFSYFSILYRFNQRAFGFLLFVAMHKTIESFLYHETKYRFEAQVTYGFRLNELVQSHANGICFFADCGHESSIQLCIFCAILNIKSLRVLPTQLKSSSCFLGLLNRFENNEMFAKRKSSKKELLIFTVCNFSIHALISQVNLPTNNCAMISVRINWILHVVKLDAQHMKAINHKTKVWLKF